jgi:hypothetical protein
VKQVQLQISKSKAPLAQMSINDNGVIETQDGKLQADFANRSIGGGVLHHGCVQEEIRFVISPELLTYARSRQVRIWCNGTMLDAAA